MEVDTLLENSECVTICEYW